MPSYSMSQMNSSGNFLVAPAQRTLLNYMPVNERAFIRKIQQVKKIIFYAFGIMKVDYSFIGCSFWIGSKWGGAKERERRGERECESTLNARYRRQMDDSAFYIKINKMDSPRWNWLDESEKIHTKGAKSCATQFFWIKIFRSLGKKLNFSICVCRYHDVGDAHLSIRVTFPFSFFKNVNDTHECRQKCEHENSYTFSYTIAREFTRTKRKILPQIYRTNN